VYYGVILGLVLYNLFLFFATRDRVYLFYVVAQAAMALALAGVDKYTFQLLWPDYPGWAARSEQFFGSLAMLTGLAYTRAFLGTRRAVPRLDRVLVAMIVLAAALVMVTAFTDRPAVKLAGAVHVLVSLSAASAAALLCARSANGRLFLVAWSVFIAGTAVAVLGSVGVLETLHGFDLMKLGSGAEATLMSIALASRINALERAKQGAQAELLAAKTARIAAMSRLVSGIAHEIGNPLNYARGGAEAVTSALDEPDGAARAKRASSLVTSGLDRMKRILDNLRAYLRSGEVEDTDVDVAEELRQAIALTSDAMAERGVVVTTEISPLPVIAGRPGELHQVFVNLLTNALQAMPDGGALRVRAAADDAAVQIAVEDDGPGIAPEIAADLFEPFVTTRKDAGGTGLGLAVAREIVLRHRGQIALDHAADRKGARFVVTLPVPSKPG
jgi:signal transduction histidine kinase